MTQTHNHLVCKQTKCLWIRVTSQSLKHKDCAKLQNTIKELLELIST